MTKMRQSANGARARFDPLSVSARGTKKPKTRMISRRSAFEAPLTFKIKESGTGKGEAEFPVPGTSCCKKRCKTSIADKMIPAPDIPVKEARRDTVTCRHYPVRQCRYVRGAAGRRGSLYLFKFPFFLTFRKKTFLKRKSVRECKRKRMLVLHELSRI